MELRELLRRRRMVRSYRDDAIPRDTPERIVRVIRHAPSAGFSQGQRILVVTDEEARRRMVEIVGGETSATTSRSGSTPSRCRSAGFYGVPRERPPAFKELLGIPEDVAVACVLTLGRAAPENGPDRSSRGTRPRRPLEELVRWERWSS